MTDLAQRRSELEDRLKALDARLHEIEDELDSHQSKDWEELATEREGDEVLERLGVTGSGRNRPHPRRAEADGRGRIRRSARNAETRFRRRGSTSALDPVLQDLRHLTRVQTRRMEDTTMGVRPSDRRSSAGSRSC
jgi:hypothetical protein